MQIPNRLSRQSRIVAMGAFCCLFGLCSASTSAQTVPLADPTVDQLIRALSGASVSKAISFRRTSAPDAGHFCPEVSGPVSNISGASRKNLEVVPYDGGHTANADLDVRFALGSDKLEPAGRRLLDTLAQALRDPRLAQGRFAIAGHTDTTGQDRLNRELSCARAIATRAYLIKNGVAGDRLSAYGFGSGRLLDSVNPTSGSNRRVELRRDIDFKGD